MSIDPHQIARRFAELTPERRQTFLAKLEENGIRFTDLPIVALPRLGAAPLSAAQRGLWIAWQREPDSPAYNLAGVLRLGGLLDVGALEQACNDLLARHEALRTSFTQDVDGEPQQCINPARFQALVCLELGEDASRQRAQALTCEPFDLQAGPALRLELHRLGPRQHRLVIVLHHILADGWSIGLIIEDLAAAYAARRQGQAAPWPPLAVQYADYAGWQQRWLDAGEQTRQLDYWRRQLEDDHTPLALPLDRPRSAVRDPRGASVRMQLPADTSERLRHLAKANGATTFMAMLALLNLLLARHSGADKVRIGSPLANRTRAETQRVVGYFTTLSVLSNRVDERWSFTALLKQVRGTLLEAQEHSQLPFDQLLQALAPPREAGTHPLFQVKCTEQSASRPQRFADLSMSLDGLAAGDVHFDLSVDFTDRADGIEVLIAYACDLFDAERIEALAGDLASLADAVSLAPGQPLLELAVEPEYHPDAPAIAAEDVLAAWQRQYRLSPDAAALTGNGITFSRAQINHAAQALGQRLLARGVGPGARVALLTGRTPGMVIGILAVLQCGAAYVPIDPRWPAERRAAVLADSGACFVLGADPQVPGLSWLTLDLDLPMPTPLAAWPAQVPQLPAYLIYTSGSSGTPKAVVATRGNLAAYVAGLSQRLQLPARSSFAMVSTVAADLGHTVLFLALSQGGLLHLADDEHAFDPDAFAHWQGEQGADVLKITPSHLQALLNARDPARVLPRHTLILGGEATSWRLLDDIRKLAPQLRVFNHYGPTETTVGALCQDAAHADRLRARTLPIGTPLAGVQVRVLDAYLNPVARGVVGELYLGGPGVTQGYSGRPGLTAERYVPDLYGAPGARLYRSGDRVRRLDDGSLEYLGRSDDQVKVRGYRVEPGEVSAAIRRLAGVRDAAVIAVPGEDGGHQLHAYLVLAAGAAVETLRQSLAAQLPDALVPPHWTVLEQLPLTANGKLDRRALAPTQAPQPVSEGPRGPVEQALAQLWSDLLGRSDISRDASFGELGGDSLLSLKLLARIRKHGLQGERKLTLADLLNAPSLAALAERLAPPPVTDPEVVFLSRSGHGVPLFCLPGLIVNSSEFKPLVDALGGERPVYGFVSHVYTEQRWRGYDVPALAGEYADYIARTVKGGRCALLGWSSGGELALETARLLQGRAQVDLLCLVDVFESVPFHPRQPLDEARRAQAQPLLESWLGRSAMAAQWRGLFALMDDRERDALAEHVLAHDGQLPSDGPDLLSQEFEQWALLDKRLKAARQVHAPLAIDAHVWQAAHSLTRSERLRDWNALVNVVEQCCVAGAHHLDIIRHPGFMADLAQALAALEAGKRPEGAKFAEAASVF
ncbi:non-ribosomal peptide synthetase [Pseudomonas typographi]|uniref:non-ribosomal peptide synthetase n=1 Tax=Pseudomonas typographi TaxID=2715964 RepID=UPI0016841FC7|nr:non-ribosomal peptide synthetase [Pseudomonas typographi]MBD1590130.1 amino acid adenylation domain-containing protein [Pseudomonas typographi]